MENHPDLSYNVAFRCISGPIYDQVGHGTAVIGVASARNNSDYFVGVSHDVQIWSANVEVNGVPISDEVACSLNVGRVNGIFAANMSLVLAPSTAVTDQINAAYYQNGMVLVAAAGNNSGGPVGYPAYLPEVLAVAATTIDDVIWSGSASGMQLDLSAPGENVHTTTMPGGTCSDGGYTGTTCTGTSFAAPHVSAAAALLKARYPSWSNTTVRSQLISSALSLGSWNVYGAGLLRSRAALLHVTMSGTSFISSAGSYSWQANPSGGSSYSYAWEFKPAGGGWYTVGSQQSYQTSVSQLDSPYFDLRVTVTSEGFATAATRRVNVEIGGGCGPGPC
jgi:subtilisin family serine protease